MLALKSTRLSQGGATQIDWNNPITRGLVFAVVGDNATDLVTGTRRTLVSGTFGGRAIGGAGVARRFNNDSDFYAGITAADTATEFGVFTINDVQSMGNFSGLISHTSNLGNNQGWAFAQNLGALVMYAGGSNPRSMGISTAEALGHHAIYGGYGGGVFKSYFDGQARQEVTATDPPMVGAGYIKVSSSRDVRANVSRHYLSLVWDRLPSADEYASVYANPWQIFR